MAYVCPGGRLNLTCDANGTFLIWNVSVPGFRSESLTLLRDSAQTMEVLQVNMIRFNIFRQNRSTLSSVMLLDNVPVDLNKTIITCSEVPNGVTTLISKTMIHIIGNEVSQSKLNNYCYLWLAIYIATSLAKFCSSSKSNSRGQYFHTV